ncbi:AAA-ATPase [Camellia lanceoleosa]|uniref:AAA-ATPase n=1 Tax=Camellia lanceoleosa TaxID=1840588 RepID=A0ACC0GSR5_9ERIC|nr:AAA-ATPase [Camellia lanceoleosa]
MHIQKVFDEVDQRRKEVKLYINAELEPERNGQWRSVLFNHPATIDMVAMDSDLKNKVKSHLESFLKSKQYYHRLGVTSYTVPLLPENLASSVKW